MNISCIVLAGGRGVRLGRDKALETIGNQSLLQRAVSSLRPFDSEVIIVTTQEQSLLQSVHHPRLRVVADIYPGKGALGGLYTGLVTSGSLYNIVVACDMPFLSYGLLHYMIKLSSGFDAVVPRLGGDVEPLHAVYSKECLVSIQSLLKKGRLSIAELFSMIRVRYIGVEEIDKFDPKHLSFFNINTEADLSRARELAKDSLITLNK